MGPLLAAFLLARNPRGFEAVFVVSFFISVIGLGFLYFFVEDRRAPAVTGPARTRRSIMAAAAVLLRDPAFRRVWLLAVGFALLTPGDALLYLALERRVDLSAGYFPLLFFGTSVVFLLAAVPCGRLADRVGPLRVFVGGEILLVGAFVTVGSRGRRTGYHPGDARPVGRLLRRHRRSAHGPDQPPHPERAAHHAEWGW